MAITTLIADSFPVWLITGAIFVGGWMIERGALSAERLTTVETKQEAIESDIREIKAGVIRIEDHLMGY